LIADLCQAKAQSGVNPLWIYEHFNERLAKICIKKTIPNCACQLALKIWVVPRIFIRPMLFWSVGLFIYIPYISDKKIKVRKKR
jgi:hypothetical protein